MYKYNTVSSDGITPAVMPTRWQVGTVFCHDDTLKPKQTSKGTKQNRHIEAGDIPSYDSLVCFFNFMEYSRGHLEPHCHYFHCCKITLTADISGYK